MEDFNAIQQSTKAILQKKLENKAQVLERQTYQLIWEFRRMSMTGQASVLRFLILPDNYGSDWITKNIPLTRQDVSNRPDVQAAWIGRSQTDDRQILYRTNWSSLQAQQDYFASNLIQNNIATYKADGITLNYASFDLKGIVYGTD